MKRMIALILALMMALALCACGNTPTSNTTGKDTQSGQQAQDKDNSADEPTEQEQYAKVTYANGTTETFDVGELPSLCRENKFAFNQKYAGNKAEVVAKVTSIGSGYGTYGFCGIDFSGGWNVYLKTDDPVLVDLRNGMTVKIVGTLQEDSWSIGGASVTIIE